jgi:ABC-type antimicrobial peptide transport system permease subunit
MIVVAGVTVGVFGAVAFSRILESRLFGITPMDPLTYAVAAASVALVAALACLAPALTAMRVDPMITLRED